MTQTDMAVRGACLLLITGLLGTCTAQRNEVATVGPPPVQELTQLPPTFASTPALRPPEAFASGVGKTVYVPVYSHVYYLDGRQHLLAATLSIRNTSLKEPILVTSVRYYNSEGFLVKEYTKKDLQIPPMATADFFVEQDDTSGGSGANFLVKWNALKGASLPIVEAVMVSTSSGQGISMISPGRVVEED